MNETVVQKWLSTPCYVRGTGHLSPLATTDVLHYALPLVTSTEQGPGVSVPWAHHHLTCTLPTPCLDQVWLRWEKSLHWLLSLAFLESLYIPRALDNVLVWLQNEWLLVDLSLGRMRLESLYHRGPCLGWGLSLRPDSAVEHPGDCGDSERGGSHTLHACVQLQRPVRVGLFLGFGQGARGRLIGQRALRGFCVCSVSVLAFFGITVESGPAWSFLCLGSQANNNRGYTCPHRHAWYGSRCPMSILSTAATDTTPHTVLRFSLWLRLNWAVITGAERSHWDVNVWRHARQCAVVLWQVGEYFKSFARSRKGQVWNKDDAIAKIYLIFLPVFHFKTSWAKTQVTV